MEVELENNKEIDNNKSTNQIISKSIEEEQNTLDCEVTAKKQNEFLESTLGRTINTAMNVGIRYLLPNIIENQVIAIKDTILQEGFREGINKTIESAMDLGKSAMGILTGKFDNVTQMQTAVEKGGLIDTISDCIDLGLKVANESGALPRDVSRIIKNGKNVIMENIESNIENTLTTQIKGIEKLNKYINNWQTYYNEKNFDNMELEYGKIREQIKNLVPLEETLKKAHQVENLHKLIKNKGKDFNLSEEEINLAKKIS